MILTVLKLKVLIYLFLTLFLVSISEEFSFDTQNPDNEIIIPRSILLPNIDDIDIIDITDEEYIVFESYESIYQNNKIYSNRQLNPIISKDDERKIRLAYAIYVCRSNKMICTKNNNDVAIELFNEEHQNANNKGLMSYVQYRHAKILFDYYSSQKVEYFKEDIQLNYKLLPNKNESHSVYMNDNKRELLNIGYKIVLKNLEKSMELNEEQETFDVKSTTVVNIENAIPDGKEQKSRPLLKKLSKKENKKAKEKKEKQEDVRKYLDGLKNLENVPRDETPKKLSEVDLEQFKKNFDFMKNCSGDNIGWYKYLFSSVPLYGESYISFSARCIHFGRLPPSHEHYYAIYGINKNYSSYESMQDHGDLSNLFMILVYNFSLK